MGHFVNPLIFQIGVTRYWENDFTVYRFKYLNSIFLLHHIIMNYINCHIEKGRSRKDDTNWDRKGIIFSNVKSMSSAHFSCIIVSYYFAQNNIKPYINPWYKKKKTKKKKLSKFQLTLLKFLKKKKETQKKNMYLLLYMLKKEKSRKILKKKFFHFDLKIMLFLLTKIYITIASATVNSTHHLNPRQKAEYICDLGLRFLCLIILHKCAIKKTEESIKAKTIKPANLINLNVLKKIPIKLGVKKRSKLILSNSLLRYIGLNYRKIKNKKRKNKNWRPWKKKTNEPKKPQKYNIESVLALHFGQTLCFLLKKSGINNIKIYFTELTEKKISSFHLALYIRYKLRRKFGLYSAIMPLIKHLRTFEGIQGFKIACSGRVSRRQRATYFWRREGKLGTSSFNSHIDYAFLTFPLKFGACGVKVWLSYRNPNVRQGRNRYLVDIYDI